MAEEKRKLIVNGKRVNGRAFNELRKPFTVKAGVLKRAMGSAEVNWGTNKVIAGVYGPREVFPKHLTDPHKALINARYIMAPFSGAEEHGRSGPNRRSLEISKVAKHVFENVVLVRQFPKTMIDIQMEVLQSDGGTRVAAITAAAVALADAGIPLKDIVCGVSVGKVEGEIVLDVDKYEDNLGDGDIPFIVSPRTKEILLFQLDGMISKKELEKAVSLVFEASGEIHEAQVEALKAKYGAVSEEVATEGNGNGGVV
jgi:exosome complex component RRP41